VADEIASARDALEPFADFANRFGETAREDGWQITNNPSGKGNLTMGDCRNARATLKDIPKPKPQPDWNYTGAGHLGPSTKD
jgi:hypothetical protein